jgi:hypothetical protein
VASTLECASPALQRIERTVASWSVVRAGYDDLTSLRRAPGPLGGAKLPNKFLRHADEQTVVGLSAVLHGIDRLGLPLPSFRNWSVLAATQYFGRTGTATALRRYEQLGPKSVSPHSIPQLSLHALSGAISVALNMRGPNLGIGGGPGALAEGLLAALTFVGDESVPGVWLVLTQWEREPVPVVDGRVAGNPTCCAVALALVRGDAQGMRMRLQFGFPAVDQYTASSPDVAGLSSKAATVAELARCLQDEQRQETAAPWTCWLDEGGRVDLIGEGSTEDR